MTVENLSLHRFQKRMEEMRTLMAAAHEGIAGVNARIKENVENQRKINAMLEENKRKREELLNPKPKKPHLTLVK